MFLRKVHRTFPDSVLKDIMNKDFGHTYELLHNQAKQKKGIFTLSNIFTVCFILLVGLYFITTIHTKVFMNP
jgi:hypothetical protein